MTMVTKKDIRNYDADAALLAALASPVRLQSVALLHACPDGLSVTDLTGLVNQRRSFPLAQSTMSAHLRRLMVVGLVVRDRSRVPWVFYRLVGERIAAVREILGGYAEPPTKGGRG